MNARLNGAAGRLPVCLAIACLAIAGCSGTATPSAATGGGSADAPAASTPAAEPGGAVDASTDSSGGGGAEGSVQGSLQSTGAYNAMWRWQAGNAADPGTGGVTLNSDKGTFGNVSVLNDGSITFTSGAPELTAGSYKGTGAQVTVTNGAPCSFTLDNDVTGSNGQVLHLKGQLTITGGAFC